LPSDFEQLIFNCIDSSSCSPRNHIFWRVKNGILPPILTHLQVSEIARGGSGSDVYKAATHMFVASSATSSSSIGAVAKS
jgi:hypothetical protein